MHAPRLGPGTGLTHRRQLSSTAGANEQQRQAEPFLLELLLEGSRVGVPALDLPRLLSSTQEVARHGLLVRVERRPLLEGPPLLHGGGLLRLPFGRQAPVPRPGDIGVEFVASPAAAVAAVTAVVTRAV